MSVAKNISVAKKIFVTPKGRARSMSAKVPDPVDKHVGSRLRMRRRMLRMTQRKLGHKLGLTFQQVQKYEKGTNRVSAGRLHALSNILEVPVPFFFDGCPQNAGVGAEAPPPAYVSDFLASDGGLKLAEAFTQIGDAKLRRSLVRLVEELGGESDK
jgi:transcriptional regulator with XRE-family HTH domain